MQWMGKIIGASLGAVGGPVGVAVGAFLGHQYDLQVAKRQAAQRGDPGQLFFHTTFRVMGHVAKADGRVSEREIAAARSVMAALRLSPAQVMEAIACFTQGKAAGFNLEDDLAALCQVCSPEGGLRSVFVELQLRAALAGNDLSAPVRQRLARIAGLLGFDAAALAGLEAALRGGRTGFSGEASAADIDARMAAAYRVLEIQADADDAEVVKAYRRQMSRHHPDKLKANGLPDSMLEHAKQRTQQVREAYEFLRERRGLG